MNASLFDRARAERFAQLLDEAGGGRRHHARVKLDDELGGLVELGKQLDAMQFNGAPTPEFRADLRAQLLATAEREGIGVTAEPEPRSLRSRIVSARPRARGAIVVGVAAGTLALSGVSVASGEAIPGDTLYGMKRSTERAQLALAGSDASRGQLNLEFARTRLQEAYEVRSVELSFSGSLRDMDSETQQGVRTLITTALQQNDTTALDAIDHFVAGQRMLVAKMLDLSTDQGRQKVTESLQLLTQVEARSKAMRAALACGATGIGNDVLGPVPGACGPVRTQPAPAAAGQPRSTQPSSQSGPVEGAIASQAPLAPAASAAPTPAADPQPEKKEAGLLDELGRILGGILG